jgi:hypothetical protein
MNVMHRPSQESVGRFTLRAHACHALHVEMIEAEQQPALFDFAVPSAPVERGGLFG